MKPTPMARVTKSGEDRIREAVSTRIDGKRQEVAEYTESTVSEAGESAGSAATG